MSGNEKRRLADGDRITAAGLRFRLSCHWTFWAVGVSVSVRRHWYDLQAGRQAATTFGVMAGPWTLWATIERAEK
jgi:hypothetical protein